VAGWSDIRSVTREELADLTKTEEIPATAYASGGIVKTGSITVRINDSDFDSSLFYSSPFEKIPQFERALVEISRNMDSSIMDLMLEREAEFSTPIAARIAAIAMDSSSRTEFENQLDTIWDQSERIYDAEEVVIGGGLHAAIYCSVRRQRGFPRPLVLESGPRVGGAFAMSKQAAFYLNSRNRPGTIGLPGSGSGGTALNVIPGGPIQPSDLSGDEYQRNTDLALAIRVALAMNADVMTNARVTRIQNTNNRFADPGLRRYLIVTEQDNRFIFTDRIIVAKGLGEPLPPPVADPRIITFTEFMARMDQPFPLRGMDRVAVIGGGDSGKTVVEALTGQGPSTGMSVAALDYPRKIAWFGLGFLQESAYRSEWERCVRSRYKGLSRYFPKNSSEVKTSRIFPVRDKTDIEPSYEGVRVREVPYDWAILCTGFRPAEQSIQIPEWGETVFADFGGRIVGTRYTGQEVVQIGPGAQIPINDNERRRIERIPENSAALFRYADRTALLASRLESPTRTTR
jgi:hypothetical protein